jgi:macrodomain Ter protein organizer (MatP/YcbG family)
MQSVMRRHFAITDSIGMLSVMRDVLFSKEICFLSKDARGEARIERQIEKVKRDLAAQANMRPGSLSTQYNVCGSPESRCKASQPKKHGFYYWVSYTRKGKSGTEFFRKEELPAIREKLRNFERMKLLVDRWIELATELSNLRLTGDRPSTPWRTRHSPAVSKVPGKTRRFQAPSAMRLTIIALHTGSLRRVCEMDQWLAEVRRLR